MLLLLFTQKHSSCKNGMAPCKMNRVKSSWQPRNSCNDELMEKSNYNSGESLLPLIPASESLRINKNNLSILQGIAPLIYS